MLRLFMLMSAAWLAGCASVPSPAERGHAAEALVQAHGWQRLTLPAGAFSLAAFVPGTQTAGDTLAVYIEGDGLAWVTGDTPSADPTPGNPVGLKLALEHPNLSVAYLARPCQYSAGRPASICTTAYWTDKRFAPEVVAATSAALDALKARAGAKHIQLVGYSGGGAVAALVAAQRTDITLLATVAGNLDSAAWTRRLHLSPLKGSLNPADFAAQLAPVKQVHWVGAADTTVPPWVAESFSARFEPTARPTIRVVPGYNHACCWAANWAQLWRELGH